MKHITAKDNPTLKFIQKLLKSAKFRRESSAFVCEGKRLCEDALLSGCEIISLIVSYTALDKYSDLTEKISQKSEEAIVLPDSLYAKISDTKTPQGILCVIKTLDNPSLFDKIKCNGKFLALDNIQDPVNLGTILRTAEAFGIDGIILSSDCCDIYSPKVVRGSMGAVFRLSYTIVDSVESFLNSYRDINSFAAVVDRNAEKLTDISFDGSCVVCIGNEGNGLRRSVIGACGKAFTIPMNGRAESLNAAIASSVIMWEMVK